MRARSLIHSILGLLLLGFSLIGGSPLHASNSLGLGDIGSIPSVIVDTQTYSLSFFVINNDPSASLTDEVSIQMQVDGGATFDLISGVSPDVDVAPGDSFEVLIPNYQFPAYRFRGTSITHDIIVWPMRVGATQTDSVRGAVNFVHTDPMSSDELGLATPVGLPEEVVYGEHYDLSFDVINLDSDNFLYHEVDIVYTIDGEGPYVWVEDHEIGEPLAPGEQTTVTLSDYVFPAERHGGTSVTHDIIVWPMAQFVDNPQPVSVTLTFLPFPVLVDNNTPILNGVNSPAPLTSGFSISPAGANGTDVEVNWETNYETEEGVFIIQESNSPKPSSPLIMIPSQGNPELSATYHYVLPRPTFEGATYELIYAAGGEFYEMGTDYLEPHTGPRVQISGNPIQSGSMIQIWGDEAGEADLQVFDLGGRTIFHTTQSDASGWIQFDLPLLEQPEGVYYYRLTHNGATHTGTLVRE